ncbi:hypothetical protein BB559_003149 [Furculomyces boomerangus]|uniref:Glutathione peroxidase n=2 Tax=Harpellales TaxID=61421 RepID=A0A2T9YNC8_9FUNG|nr:hypothetical protein BB559_003149 [Furculomyces boomerangus]PWA03434.1 hypothetical protein BB558_000404 [Smittium angustum]
MSTAASRFYSLVVKDNKGKDFSFASLRNKVVLIVNVASKCGLTPQYQGLEDLYKKYMDHGLVILGFPCNQFGLQEPGTEEEISNFCSLNYGVTFPLMKKSDVNGKDENEVFKLLKSEKPGSESSSDILWNFEKFLVDKNGNVSERYHPKTIPSSIEQKIKELLA